MTNRLLLQCLVAAVGAVAIIGAFLLDPIPQDPAYHAFADDARRLGVPNFWNVATNLPFLFIGLAGLARVQCLSDPLLDLHYRVFCIGVALVALGSAYYHFDPSTPALVWDRLPMTIAFMALFAAVRCCGRS
jgi:Ceramidase